ncbi:DUF2807 domain-containing protein, partial [Dysgonomonas sp. OttesenSCG-928-M03]|nr:DUF2807 domain-containing protein [Dysgonomonas sp. OttesenSCG-928-M03]
CVQMNGIQGNRNIKSQEFDISDYSGIDLSGSGSLVYEQKPDAEPYLSLEIDENLIEYISVEVVDGKLIIKNTQNIDPTQYNIYTNSAALSEAVLSGSGNLILSNGINSTSLAISLNGSGKIEGANLNCKDVTVNLFGSGSVMVAGNSEKSTLKLIGSGKISAKELITQKSKTKVAGSGGVYLDVADSLDAEIQGSGYIKYIGTPGYLNKSVLGSGSVSAE